MILIIAYLSGLAAVLADSSRRGEELGPILERACCWPVSLGTVIVRQVRRWRAARREHRAETRGD